MTVAFRDGQPGDGGAVSALFCQAFTATFGNLYSIENLAMMLAERTPAAFEARLGSSDWAFRLAEEDGVLIGYATGGENELPGDLLGPTWELHHLYLDEAAKGRGIADVLFAWVCDEARRRNYHYLQLSVFVDNHRARRFYEKHGLEEVGKYVFMVGNHEDDDRVMRLKL